MKTNANPVPTTARAAPLPAPAPLATQDTSSQEEHACSATTNASNAHKLTKSRSVHSVTKEPTSTIQP